MKPISTVDVAAQDVDLKTWAGPGAVGALNVTAVPRWASCEAMVAIV